MDVLEDLKGRARKAAEQLSLLLSPNVSASPDHQAAENDNQCAGPNHSPGNRASSRRSGSNGANGAAAAGASTSATRNARSRKKASGRRLNKDGTYRKGSGASQSGRQEKQKAPVDDDSWQREVAEIGPFTTLVPGHFPQEQSHGGARIPQSTSSSSSSARSPSQSPSLASSSLSPASPPLNPRLFPPRSASFPPLLPPAHSPAPSPAIPPRSASPRGDSPPPETRSSPASPAVIRSLFEAPRKSFPGQELVRGQPSRHSLLHRLASRSHPEGSAEGVDGEENEAIPRWDGGWERRHGSSAGWPAADGSSDGGREIRVDSENESSRLVEVDSANESVQILVLRGPEGGVIGSGGNARGKKGAASEQGGRDGGRGRDGGDGGGGEETLIQQWRRLRQKQPTQQQVPEQPQARFHSEQNRRGFEEERQAISVNKRVSPVGGPVEAEMESADADGLGLLQKCIRQVSSLLPNQGCNEYEDSRPTRELAVSSRSRFRDSLSKDRTRGGLEEAGVGRTPNKMGLFRMLPIGLGRRREGANAEEVQEGMGAAERLWGRGAEAESGEGNGVGMGIGGLNPRFGRSTASFARRRVGGGAGGAGFGAGGTGGGGLGAGLGAGAGGRISVMQLRQMVEANPEAFLRAFDHVAKRVEAARKRRTVTVTSKYNSRTDILRSALSLDIPSLSPFPFPLPSLPHFPFFSSASPSSSSSSPPSSSPPSSSTSPSSSSSRPSFPLRIRAVAEGRPSSPFTRFSIAPEIGPLRLRWDRPRLVPSFGATLHSGNNSLVQIFHDLQVRFRLMVLLRMRLAPFLALLRSNPAFWQQLTRANLP
ncbi:unnamed protein product [Closterium sp. NIES-53]